MGVVFGLGTRKVQRFIAKAQWAYRVQSYNGISEQISQRTQVVKQNRVSQGLIKVIRVCRYYRDFLSGKNVRKESLLKCPPRTGGIQTKHGVET